LSVHNRNPQKRIYRKGKEGVGFILRQCTGRYFITEKALAGREGQARSGVKLMKRQLIFHRRLKKRRAGEKREGGS